MLSLASSLELDRNPKRNEIAVYFLNWWQYSWLCIEHKKLADCRFTSQACSKQGSWYKFLHHAQNPSPQPADIDHDTRERAGSLPYPTGPNNWQYTGPSSSPSSNQDSLKSDSQEIESGLQPNAILLTRTDPILQATDPSMQLIDPALQNVEIAPQMEHAQQPPPKNIPLPLQPAQPRRPSLQTAPSIRSRHVHNRLLKHLLPNHLPQPNPWNMPSTRANKS